MRLDNNEKTILQSYINTYTNTLGMDSRTAKKAAKDIIINAKRSAINEGVYNLPPDYWKEIFKMEEDKIDNKFTKYYARARKDGVKDEDIIYLFKTHPVERYMMVETQGLININAHITAMEDRGKSFKEATEFVRKHFPSYGNPLIELDYGGSEDRYLPYELIFKVNRNVFSYPISDKLKDNLKKFSSFNAYVRFLARNDKLGTL